MPAKINMSSAAPEDNQQDRIAKFEDLLPAAKLQQLNSVKDKFIADNRDDTARGFIEITNVSFIRQDDGKEVYVVETKEIDKKHFSKTCLRIPPSASSSFSERLIRSSS